MGLTVRDELLPADEVARLEPRVRTEQLEQASHPTADGPHGDFFSFRNTPIVQPLCEEGGDAAHLRR